MVGKDRYLYRCTDAGWVKVNDDDTDLPDCKGSRQQNVGLDPVIPSKEQTYMYLVKYTSGSEQTFYRCKMKHREDQDAKNTCIITCGDYYSGICNRDHANDIVVKIVDTDNKAITSASIKYPDLTTPNNIATQKENGNYALCLNDANKELEVKISAPGHTPVTKTVRQLLDQKNQTITLQKNKSNNSNQSTPSLPAPATDKNFIMNTSDKLIITCKNTGDINCKLSRDLKPTSCEELKKDTITETNILYIDGNVFDNCGSQITKSLDKSKCPAIQTAFVGDRKYLLFCINNPNIEVRYTDEPTDTWSYAKKQCVGSWGEWDEEKQECNCTKLEGAEAVGYECQCTHNANQKYYNKLWTGCETLKDGAYIAGTKTKAQGYGYDLREIDRANSCSPTGGTWQGSTNNTCTCHTELNMELDDTGYFCNCKSGYDYTNPMAKSDGCSPKSEINYDSDDISTEFQSSEQVAPTGTEEYECTKSGGDKYENGKCICDADKHLVEYNPENAKEYSICKCMYGYIRKGAELDTDGKTVLSYPERAECKYAGTETVEKIFDSAAWRRDTENAYKHERDNAQSWENKGITAGSTLLTGEGAMKAAQAIAEQKADKKAEEQMAAYITTMGCEYGNGQQVNLGKEETLPGGNDLAKYYAEYKQLADKLKATKTALNLRPGIESEVLYDRAETGLYQYANAERQSGGFTSLSRALMNPEGADAEQWNAQKAEVAQNLQTGTLLTAGGIATGVIGNYFVNRNHKPIELKQKLNTIKTRLEKEYPEIFIPTPEEPIVEIVEPEEEQPQKPSVTTTVKVTTSDETFDSSTFDSGYITLTEPGKNALTKAANDIINTVSETYTITSINITADGYTDPDPIKSKWVSKLKQQYENNIGSLPESYGGKIDNNSKLSQARAEMVTDFLKKQFNTVLSNVEIATVATGHGDTECKNKKRDEYSSCRKVDLAIVVTGTETTTVPE
ncbi:MAG: hypothetical protein IJL21_01940 [Alphaproteobacteria bacterium]|nr:hypothetical protein [Alphaproteobacteria bacterium]